MFEFFKKHVFGFFQANEPEDESEDEDKILNKIKEIKDVEPEKINETVPKLLGQREPEEYQVEILKCVRKTGKITYLSDDYGIIDNLIYFEPSQASKTMALKENDEVVYTAYRARENESERVHKIYSLKNESWEVDDILESEHPTPEDENTEEVTALPRVMSGRVVQKKGRELFIEPINLWCSLDKVDASFVPIEGDWVSLEAVVTINAEVVDLTGEVLEVTSLKPLLSKSGCGRITLWSNIKEEGAIENAIYFTKYFCTEGYIPSLGDEIVYDAIESDQNSYKWRALKIYPKEVKSDNKDGVLTQKTSHNILCDKEGITIRPSICRIVLELHQTGEITLEVCNLGNIPHTLNYTKLNTSKNKSQLWLKSPKLRDSFTINPKDTIKYVFGVRGRFLGLSGEVVVFHFKDFRVGKTIEINIVGSKEMNKLLNTKMETVCRTLSENKYVRSNIDADLVLFGPRPWKPPKFISGERRGVYKVPDKLWTAAIEDGDGYKTSARAIKDLEEYAPYLKEDLSSDHYSDRFHTLLYLEEIEIKKNFRNFDMNGVFFLRNGDYLVLEVPGLVERRPSLIGGDKVIVSQPWSEKNNVQNVGYIHEIRQKEIFVKFHTSFHDTYDESECDVIFDPNLRNLSSCHDAINRSMKKLGPKWLFPSAVNEKPPQVNFEIVDDEMELPKSPNIDEISEMSMKMFECTIDEGGYIVRKNNPEFLQQKNIKNERKLVWFNKNLNERQKLAVVNVMKGLGRPLPYVVFGPPGTGKTITLMEVAMQTYKLIPESRLLIATPSNSSADLICERLIEFGKFKPGQLVRLVAFHRAAEGKIPEKLIPYSSVVDTRDDTTRNLKQIDNKSNIRSSSLSQLIGRQRITVGTCCCLGSLHYMGFPSGHFTHILVDEAGQATEPEILIPISFLNQTTGQVVLVGDPQQLGPVCMSRVATNFGLGVSFLQRLVSAFPYERDFDSFANTSGYDPRFITRLNVNYRSLPEILSLPSQLFYNSELIPTVSPTDSVEAGMVDKLNFEAEGRDKPPAIIFHGIVGQNYQESDSPSWFNPHEIWQTVTYLKKCYAAGLTSDQVGIVTPYVKQVQKLRSLLTALEMSQPKIGTVEDFQGQERYVIIVSTVRSSFFHLGADIVHSLGFVASPRRLNVAITRARALVIVLGNPFLLSKDPYWKNVVEYCVKNKSYTGCNMTPLCSTSEIE